MQITDTQEKLATLRRYAQAGEYGGLEVARLEDEVGSSVPWGIRLQFGGETYEFGLNGSEIAAIFRDPELHKIPELFGKRAKAIA